VPPHPLHTANPCKPPPLTNPLITNDHRELHIREDERHGRQMLDDVALPLVDM